MNTSHKGNFNAGSEANKQNTKTDVKNPSPSMDSNHGDKGVDKVLGERGTVYGRFETNATMAQELKDVLAYYASQGTLDPYMVEAIQQILSKISRIVCGNPNYKDNWTDIAGYSTLVAKILDGENP